MNARTSQFWLDVAGAMLACLVMFALGWAARAICGGAL